MVSPAALLKLLLAASSLAASGGPPTVPVPASPSAAVRPSAAPLNVSPDANADLALLPKRPAPPQPQPAVRWEYVTVVTLLSAPFTALWYGLAVGIVESVAQRRLPPKFTTPMYAGLGVAAGATSLSIALVSVSWGGAHSLSPSAEASTPGPAAKAAP